MNDTRTLRRLERQIWELLAWRDVSATNIEPWTGTGSDGIREIRIGDRWDDLGSPVRIETTLMESPHDGATLQLFAEGDGLVFLDGRLAGALSPFEREIPLAGSRQIAVEISPNDAFGEISTSARLVTARAVIPNESMRALHRELLMAWETCAELADHDVAPSLLTLIDETLRLVRLPSDADEVLRHIGRLREELFVQLDVARSLNHHYHYLTPQRAIERLLGETMHYPSLGPAGTAGPADPTGVEEALSHLRGKLSGLAAIFPPVGRLAATSHAHLDVAWLWPLFETRRKIRHTFASVLALMDRHDDFHFTASSAQLYAYVLQDDPELFERIRARVAEGRIEPIGGMWLEPDCNLPTGESLARHLLYGQRFFDREFGRRSKVAWLPDTFGLTGNLPQILVEAGIQFFFTQKLSWNDTNRFPYDLWLWEGIDGSRVIAHSFENPIGGYNGLIAPEAFEATWRNFRGKAFHPESLFTFGMGDGGRGPTTDMLERIHVLDGFPTLPAVRQTTAEEFFSRITPDHLPVWEGELYLEFHRGTYTTQARIKRLNRMAEHRLQEAETAATLANLVDDDYPRAELDELWTTLLRNQFHDILPGSSIREVNEQAEQELGTVVGRAIELRDRSIAQLGEPKSSHNGDETGSIIVFNPQSFERPLSCVVPRPSGVDGLRFTTGTGAEISWQATASGDVLLHDPGVIVPGTGYVELAIEPRVSAPSASGVTASEVHLENNVLRVEIGPDGSIASLVDKRVDREVLAGPGNQLRLFHDLPAAWEAWNLTDTSRQDGELLDLVESIRVLESGPLRAVVEVDRSFGSSHITQRYSLRAGSARLDIHTVIDWHERRRLLRTLFPLAVRSPRATFETCFGALERPTHRNTSWDAAKFEVPAQRWADLSEAGCGVSLLNDGRYGHSALNNVLGISLLRSPLDPDPHADLGRHEFTYAIYPHLGDWNEGDTVREAIDLNSPLVARSRSGPTGSADRYSWADIDGLTAAALKRAEDSTDVVVRLYDPYGRHGTARVTPHFPVEQAGLTNLLEEPVRELQIDPDGSVRFPYRPFQVLTLRLKRTRINVN